MDNNASQPSEKPELPTKLKLENTVDHTASNDTLPAPASSSR